MAILHVNVVVAVHNVYKIVEGNQIDAKVDRNIYLSVLVGIPTAFICGSIRFDFFSLPGIRCLCRRCYIPSPCMYGTS